MFQALNRSPAYQQLNEALRALIGGGEFAVGSQFLTERQIAERFGVSRATANKALSNLVSEHVLEFKPGVGTFVRGGVLNYDLKRLVSFTDRARAAGKKPATRVLRWELLAGGAIPAEAREALGVAEDEEVWFAERLRLADGAPMILERRHFAKRDAPALRRGDLEGSLYAYWAEKCGLTITGAEQVIRAESLSKNDAEILRVARGSAALLVIATGFVESSRPLWFERTLYRADAYEFQTRLGAWRAAEPAVGRFFEAAER
jgi:GntR family transcriptional regulator